MFWYGCIVTPAIGGGGGITGGITGGIAGGIAGGGGCGIAGGCGGIATKSATGAGVSDTVSAASRLLAGLVNLSPVQKMHKNKGTNIKSTSRGTPPIILHSKFSGVSLQSGPRLQSQFRCGQSS